MAFPAGQDIAGKWAGVLTEDFESIYQSPDQQAGIQGAMNRNEYADCGQRYSPADPSVAMKRSSEVATATGNWPGRTGQGSRSYTRNTAKSSRDPTIFLSLIGIMTP